MLQDIFLEICRARSVRIHEPNLNSSVETNLFFRDVVPHHWVIWCPTSWVVWWSHFQGWNLDLFHLEMRQPRHHEESSTNHPAMRHHIPGRRETNVEADSLSFNPSNLLGDRWFLIPQHVFSLSVWVLIPQKSSRWSFSCNPSNFLSLTVWVLIPQKFLSLTVWVLIPQTFSATADF